MKRNLPPNYPLFSLPGAMWTPKLHHKRKYLWTRLPSKDYRVRVNKSQHLDIYRQISQDWPHLLSYNCCLDSCQNLHAIYLGSIDVPPILRQWLKITEIMLTQLAGRLENVEIGQYKQPDLGPSMCFKGSFSTWFYCC